MKVGLSAHLTHKVTERDLATNWSNDVPVLATPVLLWLSELACMQAIKDELEKTEISVGVGHNAEHLAPTPLDVTVTIQATLEEARGNRLVFAVEGRDSLDLILKGTHTRQIVDSKRFHAKLKNKASRD